MEVICLETKAFYDLVDKVVKRMKGIESNEKQDKWVSEQEAMRLLRVTSKTTISKLRNNGDIRFSQPRKKIILYDTESINEYLEKHAKDTF
ncbi:helix-turn-helix protein [Maribacter spongiicola]|uniref:Helix-turn-helix protein n=1 Tax=Maribacter spongiicola TaxID=1206753 RepID=A0A4R7K115_9FLAO|nr:helix-turn-helix domain-containing protein [Maribacter spongiicola]TDT43657.1 helix-turn-helix protein [Maribacter spongiicola]